MVWKLCYPFENLNKLFFKYKFKVFEGGMWYVDVDEDFSCIWM